MENLLPQNVGSIINYSQYRVQINKKWWLTKAKIQPSLKEIKLWVNE